MNNKGLEFLSDLIKAAVAHKPIKSSLLSLEVETKLIRKAVTDDCALLRYKFP